METIQALIKQAEQAERDAERAKEARIKAQVKAATRAMQECPLWAEIEPHVGKLPKYKLADHYYPATNDRRTDAQIAAVWFRVNMPKLAPFDVEAVASRDGWGVHLSAEGSSKRIPVGDTDAVAALLLERKREWQKSRERARQNRISDLLAAFAWQRRDRDRTEADDALAALLELAPEEEELAREKHRDWTLWHQKYLDEQQAKEAYVEKLAEYTRALEAWKERRDATVERNRAALAPLQAELDEPFTVRRLVYALVARDDGETYVETDSVYIVGEENGKWLVLRGCDNKRVEVVRYFHPVEVGGVIETRPTDESYAGRVLIHDADTWLYFRPTLDGQEIAEKANALLEPLPDDLPEPPGGVADHDIYRTKREVFGGEYHEYY